MTSRQQQRRDRQLPPAPLPREKVAGQAQAVTTVPGKAAPQNIAPVAVGADAVRVMDLGEGRQSIRWWNDGPDRVVIGGLGVTTASGIPVDADTGFVEADAPNAEWFAVSEGASTLRRVVIK